MKGLLKLFWCAGEAQGGAMGRARSALRAPGLLRERVVWRHGRARLQAVRPGRRNAVSRVAAVHIPPAVAAGISISIRGSFPLMVVVSGLFGAVGAYPSSLRPPPVFNATAEA
jgi:hypothetical protein